MGRGGPVKQPVRSRKLGLATLLALVVVVLTGTIAAQATTGKAQPGMCASIQRLGIEKQMNVHAAQILAACGRVPASSRSSAAQFSSLRLLNPSSPSVYGGPDVNEITGGEGNFPHVTQSETQTWAQGNTVVTTYNDSRTAPSCYSGGSYSTDNGVSFTNLNSRPFCTGHGTGFGDPVVVYDQSHAKWIAVFLASGCGGQGIAVWTSPDGSTWTAGPCAHSGSGDDRESGAVDNTPSSPHFGRMYVSWNNFNVGGGAIQVIHSDDGGATWSAPVNVNNTFIRNVQIQVGQDGTVFIAGMDEMGGGLGNRQNIIYRSSDGGATWNSSTTGAAFPGPGQSTCGLLRRDVPVLLAAHGLGRRRGRPERDHSLRLRAARHRL